MKKCIKLLSIMLTAAAVLAACSPKGPEQKPGDKTDTASSDPTPSGTLPKVTITSEATFDAENTATLTIKLSAASSKDVKVKLAKADVQAGKNEVPADFAKNVTIKAGELSAEVYAEADVLGLESGEYQAAIKIASAEGAEVGDPSVVYIGYTYAFKPEVNLYGDSQFASSKKATLKVALAKASSSDVKVKLAVDPTSKAEVSFDKEVTIPAGETSKEIEVTVTVPENLEAGIYPVIIKIESVENAEIGKSPSLTINLSYPFSVAITIDGAFDDWADPSIITWTMPDNAIFTQVKCMKLAADSKYTYMYVETYEVNNVEGDLTPVDIYINSDGNNDTGCIIASIDNNKGDPYVNVQQWETPGIEYYLEGLLNANTTVDETIIPGFADLTALQYYLKYNGPDGQSFWTGFDNLTSSFASNPDKIFAQGVIEGTEGKLEIRFSREAFEMTGAKAALGIKVMDGFNGWRALGIAPQAAPEAAPTYTAAKELLYIYLPPYVE